MNKLNKTLNVKRDNLLTVYFTAGYPRLEDTAPILLSLQAAGVDIIEIGMPYSDPVADGPTIQESNKRALENGMSINLLFEQLKSIKDQLTVPVVLMGYLNPVLRMGMDVFCAKCKESGVSGIILPDLPAREYDLHYREKMEANGLSNIFLITPQTSNDRIREMDNITNSFMYMVSSPGITGAKSGISEDQIKYFERVNALKLNNPRLIGFGISSNETFKQACRYSNGAIIGSAFINVLSSAKDLAEAIPAFIAEIKKGI